MNGSVYMYVYVYVYVWVGGCIGWDAVIFFSHVFLLVAMSSSLLYATTKASIAKAQALFPHR